MTAQVKFFAITTLSPVALLVAGALSGGVWAWAGLAYLTLLVFVLDQLVAIASDPGEPGVEFPAADVLLVVLALCHFALLVLAVRALAAPDLTVMDKLAVFFGFGLFFGQVSNPAAHELIHRSDKRLFSLGKWMFISHLFGHHTSAHRLVHHRWVATAKDPNSARLGEGFYRFALRAWRGSFRAGFRAENDLRWAGKPGGLHPYVSYLGGAALMLGLAGLIGGAGGVLAYVGLAGYATVQLLLSDYVQHYGLQRSTGPEGVAEPVAARHSWNNPQWFSSLLMLNAPRHSDHHAHPGRVFVALRLPENCPVLPWSLPVMGAIALLPRRWRRLMDPRIEALKTVAE